jgi:hypothetical protein
MANQVRNWQQILLARRVVDLHDIGEEGFVLLLDLILPF